MFYQSTDSTKGRFFYLESIILLVDRVFFIFISISAIEKKVCYMPVKLSDQLYK